MAKKRKSIRKVRSSKKQNVKDLMDGESLIHLRCSQCNRLVFGVTPGTKEVKCHICVTRLSPPDPRLLAPRKPLIPRKPRVKKKKENMSIEDAQNIIKKTRVINKKKKESKKTKLTSTK